MWQTARHSAFPEISRAVGLSTRFLAKNTGSRAPASPDRKATAFPQNLSKAQTRGPLSQSQLSPPRQRPLRATHGNAGPAFSAADRAAPGSGSQRLIQLSTPAPDPGQAAHE